MKRKKKIFATCVKCTKKKGNNEKEKRKKINLLAAAAKISSRDKRAKRERAVCLRGGSAREGCGTLPGWGRGNLKRQLPLPALDISMLNKIKISTDYFIHFWLSIKFL